MAHSWRIRSRSHSSVAVRIAPLICRSRSSPFAAVQVGRICKQGVVGSSPIVSTALIRHFTVEWGVLIIRFWGRGNGTVTLGFLVDDEAEDWPCWGLCASKL
jgi:hypothetical protein